MIETRPAESYTPCADLGIVTTYFNSEHYKTRRINYEIFAAPFRASGIPLLTVECAFADDQFDLPPGPDILQVKGRDVLWQKERLINLGVSRLPPTVTKVAWLDNDILFTNPDWLMLTAAKLEKVAVVQPFACALRLKKWCRKATGDEYNVESFAKVTGADRRTLRAGTFHSHGHTGFAWAARRELLAKYGLYEALLSGNGDHYMAHAMFGGLDSPCMLNLRRVSRPAAIIQQAKRRNLLTKLRTAIPWQWKQRINQLPGMSRTTGPFWEHFLAWAQPVAAATGGRIDWIPGEVLHLWHGAAHFRGHYEGWLEMLRQQFDPLTDLRIGASGCLEWASAKPALHQWAGNFFKSRFEDGE